MHGLPLSAPLPCGVSSDKKGYLVYGVVPVRLDYRVENRRDAGFAAHPLVCNDDAAGSKEKIECECRRTEGNGIRALAL